MADPRAPLRIVVAGHVDHGKSTLVGRMLHETGTLPDGKVDALKSASEKRGMPFEWAFVMDALQAERDQGITIDTAHIMFSTSLRPYVIIDAPGHKEFLKNMVTGAAGCDAALLLVDAEEGVREQTRRHGYLLHLLGVRTVAVVVNKMDRLGFDQTRFDDVAAEVQSYLDELGLSASALIPISARDGDNVAATSNHTPWYKGPTVVAALDAFPERPQAMDRPLRLPVQDVYKFDDRRLIAGRIESGRLAVGDRLIVSPSNKTARVASIETWNAPPATAAAAGESVAITLDDQIFAQRGEVISHAENAPVESNIFKARVFWLGHRPLTKGASYRLRVATASYPVEVVSIDRIINVSDLSHHDGETVERNGVAEITLRSRVLMVIDDHATDPALGRFVMVDGWDIAGGGIISLEGCRDHRSGHTVRSTNVVTAEHKVSMPERWHSSGHKSGILWLTGLSGSGKTTLALELERRLFRRGRLVYVLDGDNVRQGLSADLGFTPDERSENIRRIGEVAKLFADAGLIVITAFISPYRDDRDRARAIAGDLFHEIHIAADLDCCEARDPRGLYKKARVGEIREFTGISAPYEAPLQPELAIDTANQMVEQSLECLMSYIDAHFTLRE